MTDIPDTKTNEKEMVSKKLKSLSDLREEIDKLENEITETKRKERILSEERAEFKVFYKWEAPERPFSTKSRRWYINLFTISLIVIVLSILTETYLLIIAMFAVMILLYVMNTVPPQIINYEITNKGIKMGNDLYVWRQIPRFWMAQRGENIFLNFETVGMDLGKLIIFVGDGDASIITRELVQYIDYLTPQEVKSDIFMTMVDGKHKEIGDFFKKEE